MPTLAHQVGLEHEHAVGARHEQVALGQRFGRDAQSHLPAFAPAARHETQSLAARSARRPRRRP